MDENTPINILNYIKILDCFPNICHLQNITKDIYVTFGLRIFFFFFKEHWSKKLIFEY